ncbi:M48 family metallopeptidase [Noviherbaspirillum agri]
MNFFEQQDHARRQTRTLVILFALAVMAIIIAVNAALALIWSWTQTGYVLGIREYPKGFFLTNTVVTLLLIAGGTLIEMFNLRDGGDAVAKMAGGRLVSPSSTDLHERRLLNVVEEMALASGIACPKVYLLDREASINAFAAGYNQDEAVVAVTQGTLKRLTRDELQGVVAHEFSHILNGDMRLNIRLIGLLFGIQMLSSFGHHLLDFGSRASRSRSSNDKGGSARAFLFLTGLALVVIGAIGVFFGRLIKAAVSRQREFLADASAVQFTRNPDGIGNALRKIGGLSRTMELGSRIEHPNAEQLSHLFLGAPKRSLISGMFSTHPPIEERLRRIFGRAIGVMDAPELQIAAPAAETLPDIPYVASGFAGEETSAAHWVVASDSGAETSLPPALDNAVREPHAACAVVYALLLDDGAQREAQLAILKNDAPQQAALAPSLAKAVALLPKSARLPLLDLAMPALKQLADTDRTALLAVADRLIATDNRLTLAEFVLQTVLMRRLAPYAGRATPVRFESLMPLREECALLLSLVAHVASQAVRIPAAELFARGAAACAELGLGAEDLMKAGAIDYTRIRASLEHVHQLAPLAKPALIKALLAASGEATPMPVATADLLRAICAALEAPVPPAVADTYTHHHW